MKKLVAFTIMIATAAILGTALTGAATDETSSSHAASTKHSKACCHDIAAAVTQKVCTEGHCPDAAVGKQGIVDNSSECGGKCDLDKSTALASVTQTAKCKDGPDGNCKGDRGTSAASELASTADHSANRNCEFCKEEDCEQECSSCAEARGETSAAETDATAPHGPGSGIGHGRGMGHGHAGDSQHDKDHRDFFFLIEHRDSIRRTVKNLHNGIESLTESDDAEVAKMIQVHVEAMYDRLENANPIRMRDPIFREVFANADKIKMEIDHTDQGVRVRETSTDAYAVKLLQEHAKVVSLWIKNGYSELPKNHAAPKRQSD